MEYKKWKCTIKEVGNEHPLVTELWGCYDEGDCVRHWGLRNSDVEWYKLEEIKD